LLTLEHDVSWAHRIMKDFPEEHNKHHWHNEVGEVYTVGYLPQESVRVKGDTILNASGWVPAVIHQWDRHQNLSALVERLYG